jgi:RNA polymerase sigma-70 factor, ECF subfamily
MRKDFVSDTMRGVVSMAHETDTTLPFALSLRSAEDAPSQVDEARTETLLLFDSCALRLRRYAITCGLTPQAADDVVQDAFVQLFHHLCLGRSRQNLPGWLFTVCHRLAMKQRAKDAHRLLHERAVDAEHLEAVVDPGDDPERVVTRLDRRQRMLSVIAALPERYRQCLYLRAEGLGYREIARTLGMSLGAVAKALARVTYRLSQVKD